MTETRRKKVTAKWLEGKGACPWDLDTFKEEWPRGCVVNRKNIERAAELGIDVEWFGDEWLQGETKEVFGKTVQAAWRVYLDAPWVSAKKAIADALIKAVEA